MSDGVHHDHIPGPSGKPLVGNTVEFGSDPLSFLTRLAREYGPVARYEAGGFEFVQVSDPDLVEQVLVQRNERYEKGDRFQASLRPTLGSGLLTSEGEYWRNQRHTLEPAFYPRMLSSYAETMVDYTERLLSEWEDGETRDVHEDTMSLTVEIAAKALLDVDIRQEEGDIAEALEAVMDRSTASTRRPVQVPEWVPTPMNRRAREARETLNDVVERIVYDYRDGEPREGNDVVSLLLRASDHLGEPLSPEQIRDEVVTILLAGHETTALALTYTFHALGRNPGPERALHDEVDAVLGDRRPTQDDLDDLDYVEQTVKEGMRVYPPVWQLVREAAEPDDLDGYRIDPGTTVSMQQWVLHRDPRFYDDPETFRPERWTDDFEKSLPKFAYFPFGGGPRRCIGDRFAMLEARLVLATIAREWALRPHDDLSFSPSITLRPDGDVEMTVVRR
ncbi:cytochrome P450 [Halospeciosus flavus]|uniref:Cytochrome P450 n=1 Tax=Halospeciosus flavus TaxID=3032283 RepID=A0ABD5Z0S3_9EURY|nr:cytochrome P450 [Halospeciosus flavus]